MFRCCNNLAICIHASDSMAQDSIKLYGKISNSLSPLADATFITISASGLPRPLHP